MFAQSQFNYEITDCIKGIWDYEWVRKLNQKSNLINIQLKKKQ